MTNLERGMGSKAYGAAMRRVMNTLAAAGKGDEPATWKGDLDADGGDGYSGREVLRNNENQSSPMLFDEKRQSNSAMRELYQSYPQKTEGDILARELLQGIRQGDIAQQEGIPENAREALTNLITSNDIGYDLNPTERTLEDALIDANIKLALQTQPMELPSYGDLLEAEPQDLYYILNDSAKAEYEQWRDQAKTILRKLNIDLDSPVEREAGYYMGLAPIAYRDNLEALENNYANTLKPFIGKYPTAEDLAEGILGQTPMDAPIAGLYSIIHSHPNEYKNENGEWEASISAMDDRADPSIDDTNIINDRRAMNRELGFPDVFDYVTGTPVRGKKTPIPFRKY